MSVLTMCRPALITSDTSRLDEEFKAARRLYHRLLDFEDAHQRVLDAAAEAAAPGIVRIGRILSRLARRAWRRSRTPQQPRRASNAATEHSSSPPLPAAARGFQYCDATTTHAPHMLTPNSRAGLPML